MDNKDSNESLRGTFVAVMILGFLILGSWIGVFTLYLIRR